MLLNCVVYRDGLKQADIPVEDISDYRADRGCLLWVALKDPTPEEIALMQEEFGLHPLAVEDARHGHQRPKIEEYGDIVFVVLHLLEGNGEDDLGLGELAIFVGPNFVLSIRLRSNVPLLGVRERCEREPELLKNGPGFVLYALMDAVVDRYFPVLAALEEDLEQVEDRMFERNAGRRNVASLYAVKRRLMVLHHAVRPLIEVASRLDGGRVPQVCVGLQAWYRDVHDHLLRINAHIDTQRETLWTAVQANLAMVTIEQAETTKRLAAWASLFAVSTALAGIWGMNFDYMPELRQPWGYPAALGLIGGSLTLLWWRFRRLGWL